jgi:hypothetical protein
MRKISLMSAGVNDACSKEVALSIGDIGTPHRDGGVAHVKPVANRAQKYWR